MAMSIHHYTKYFTPITMIFLTLIISLSFLPLSSSFKTLTTLNQGASLSSPGDELVSSPSCIFTAGFHAVGDNAYCFGIWYTHAPAVVWMANRDQPVNGRNTKLSLLHSGNLVLRDAGLLPVWSTATTSSSAVALQLHDDGDLVLREEGANTTTIIWRSFDSPTDTLLPQQPLTRKTKLVSSRSPTNQSSGFYEFYFDNDNVLRLLYSGAEITSVFWPPAWLVSWEAGRSTYNTSKIAMLDPYGRFSSSDNFTFHTWDVGIIRRRRMTLDSDGLVRVYSLNKDNNVWEVSWQLPLPPCNIHGICGANSLCRYRHDLGRRCSCVPGYKIKNDRDWSEGCVPDFDPVPCRAANESLDGFHLLSHAEFYGNDFGYYPNTTLEECESLCLSYCDCRGFQFTFDPNTKLPTCFPKFLLFNGYQSLGFDSSTYLRLPNHILSTLNKSYKTITVQSRGLHCADTVVEIERSYIKPDKHGWLRSLIWCVGVLGVVELICALLFVYKTRLSSSNKLREQGFMQVATGFRRFSYAEMKKATCNFREEIGRGGSGVVYKGVLADNRVAAVKCLNFAGNQGEAEFLAEISLIGRLNHANLVETWGYCAEGKHRLLVYEYMENGSLAENLDSDRLGTRRRFEIALGTAKGLAYLHEECLEWVLHCDVKPQNVLLDGNYEAKVADFGLSKQMERSGVERLIKVSAIRGTRGYMAPEWVYNLPITAKVDVYSYGVVVLEMVKKMMNVGGNNDDGEIVLEERWDDDKDDHIIEKLMRVGMQCTQDDRDARPNMKQVVNMLLGH